MRDMLQTGLKNNIYVEKAILTGILMIGEADLFAILNNFIKFTVLDNKYAEHFGFTQEEVNDLFR